MLPCVLYCPGLSCPPEHASQWRADICLNCILHVQLAGELDIHVQEYMDSSTMSTGYLLSMTNVFAEYISYSSLRHPILMPDDNITKQNIFLSLGHFFFGTSKCLQQPNDLHYLWIVSWHVSIGIN